MVMFVCASEEKHNPTELIHSRHILG